eukprot:30844-Pelagococcus_subviridis.AAC.7
MTPHAHASTGAACALESPGVDANTSGAAYCGVPAFAPLSRSFAFFARPKSQIFTELTSSFAPRSKFSNFMSLCVMPSSWRYLTPRSTLRKIPRAMSSLYSPSFAIASRRSPPARYSVAMYTLSTPRD